MASSRSANAPAKHPAKNAPFTAKGADRRVFWLGIAILLAAVVAVYWQVVHYDFVEWDDTINIFTNPYLRPPTAVHLAHFWRSSYFELYTPVMYTFWWLCARIRTPEAPTLGLDNVSASVFHAASLLLHSLNTVLVWLLLRLLLYRIELARGNSHTAGTRGVLDNNSAAATAGTLLWALHPLQTEAVAWITGANNLLAGSFTLAALLLYLDVRTPGTRFNTRPALGLSLATFAYILALLSKPMAATTPMLALILDWGTMRRSAEIHGSPKAEGSLAKMLPMVGLWAALAVGDSILTHMTSESSQGIKLAIWRRPIIALDALYFYLGKLIVPFNFAADYGRLPKLVTGNWWGYADSLAIVVLGIVVWKSRKRVLQSAALFSFAALLPALGFVPFYLHRWSTVGDRYVYIALIGPALAIAYAWRFANMPPRLKHLAAALYGCAVVLWGVQSGRQAETWSSTHTLFDNTLSINPRSSLSMFKVGAELEREGDPDAAVEVYKKALAITPDFAPSNYDLGSILARRGELNEGMVFLRRAIALSPHYADAYNNLGMALAQQGDWKGAEANFRAAVQAKPDFGPALDNLKNLPRDAARYPQGAKPAPPSEDPDASRVNREGIELARRGDLRNAETAFEWAISIRPDYTEAFYNLGVTRDHLNNFPAAIIAYRSAIFRQTSYPEAHFNLGVDLARTGDIPAALAELRETLRQKPNWPPAVRSLDALEKIAK